VRTTEDMLLLVANPLREAATALGMPSAVVIRQVCYRAARYENIAFGVRLYERMPKSELDGRVENSLRRAALWEEVMDKLCQRPEPVRRPAAAAVHWHRGREAGGDPVRRALLGARPDLDRKDRGADRRAQGRLHHRHRHPHHAAGRVSDFTAFMYLGEPIEFDTTSKMFTAPRDRRTQDYITGPFG
jgi:phosphate transport system ATP-binding protein